MDAHQMVFKEYGIQSQHFNVLRILKGKHPETVSPSYIKSVMLDKGRDLTRLVDKLVLMGWVERCNCPENKRRININLSNLGLENLEILNANIDLADESLKVMTDEEYNLLSDLLDKMRG